MKTTKYSGSAKRSVLFGMATSAPLLARIVPQWQGRMFDSPDCDTIGRWCIDYYNKTGEAPGTHLTGIFRQWAEEHPDDPALETVERLLNAVSGSADDAPPNVAALAATAEKLFKAVGVRRLIAESEVHLENNRPDKALELIQNFKPVQMGERSRTHIHADEERIRRIFTREEDDPVLIRYPGPLGEFFGNTLHRGGLFTFFAPEKAGKSFFLIDMAHRCAEARHRVAYFEAGDMGEDEVNERFYMRALRRPFEAKTVNIPKTLEAGDPAHVTYKVREFEKMTPDDAVEGMKKYNREKTRSKGQFLAHSYHPTGTLSVKDIESILTGWEQDGWGPVDSVVIDYADILAPPPGIKEDREKINATWMALRALALAKHCLVVTASQADANSYGKRTLTGANFSNDKRKNAHATAVVAINATTAEQEAGVCRFGWLFRRKGRKTPQVTVASCLDIANPAVVSAW